MATQGLDTKTRDRIIEAAGAVFAEKGYEAATVREICSHASANLAAVNYYFGDKHRLYVEAIRQAHAQRVERTPIPEWAAGAPAELKLHGFVLALLTRMLDDQGASWHAPLMLRELSSPAPACMELVSEYIRPHFELLQGILQELTPPGTPEAQLHLTAFSIVGQCLYFRVARKVVRMLVEPNEYAGYTPEMLADHITRFTLSALGQAPAAQRAGGRE